MYNRAQRRKDTDYTLKEMKGILNSSYEDIYDRMFTESIMFLTIRSSVLEINTGETLEGEELAEILGSHMAFFYEDYKKAGNEISDKSLMQSMINGYLQMRYCQHAQENLITVDDDFKLETYIDDETKTFKVDVISGDSNKIEDITQFISTLI